MIRKYSCTIRPSLNSKYFKFLSEKQIQDKLKKIGFLSKWLYFYVNEPNEPLTIWVGKSFLKLEPGTNRYIGTGLLQDNREINGIVLVEDDAIVPDEITLLDLIEESSEYDFTSATGVLNKDMDIVKWALGEDNQLNSEYWYDPVYEWFNSNLKYTWCLDVQGTKLYIDKNVRFHRGYNQSTQIKKTIKVYDYTDFIPKVIELFDEICRVEGFKKR